jgi:2-haloacid dehalogenase
VVLFICKGGLILKNYQALFFDLDDTLLDFGAAEKAALGMLCVDQNFTFTSEMEENYKELNKRLWKAYEEGEMDRDEVVNTRFSAFFKEYGVDVDGVFLEQRYRSFLNEGHQLVDGALELVLDLAGHYDLYAVTNGVSQTQYKRLHGSGLFPLFKDIFVSEDVGFQKPRKEFFDSVFARVPVFAPEQGLLIGDSLNADIKGGHTVGLDTCWFNPELKVNNTDILPTYQIQRLKELYEILGVRTGAIL